MNVFNMQFDVCKGDIFFIKFKLYFNDMADHWIQEALIAQIVRTYGFDPVEYTIVTNNTGEHEIVVRPQTTYTVNVVNEVIEKK